VLEELTSVQRSFTLLVSIIRATPMRRSRSARPLSCTSTDHRARCSALRRRESRVSKKVQLGFKVDDDMAALVVGDHREVFPPTFDERGGVE